MSNLASVQSKDFSSAEVQLIRETIAPNATPIEFDLFLYRCKHMGLDPLKPGQIFFIKYGNSAGSIVIGREGFRVRAAKTGKHTGTKLGTLRNNDGKCVGAWCEVYRSDWQHPARAEVSLSEYNTGKSQWAKMPETMIQKVAEAAALRMAFPDELGGIYIREEMEQGEGLPPKIEAPRDVSPRVPPQSKPLDNYSPDIHKMVTSPEKHVITFGIKYLGLTIAEAVDRDGVPEFENWLGILETNAKKNGYDRPPSDHQMVIDKYHMWIKQEEKVEAMIEADRMGLKGTQFKSHTDNEWRNGR